MTTIRQQKVNEAVRRDELIGRAVMTEWLTWKYEGTGRDLHIVGTPLKCSVDLKCDLLDRDLQNRKKTNIEVKVRHKNQRQVDSYPHGELKIGKYDRMRAATEEGTGLFYAVFLDNEDTNRQTLYLWDMDKVNWDNVGQFDWVTKKCEKDPESETIVTPTYQIPFTQAVVKEDVTDIFNAYIDESTWQQYSDRRS